MKWPFCARSLSALVSAVAAVTLTLASIPPGAAMVGGAPGAIGSAAHSVVTILSSYGTFCTATALARDLLLTAGHCVEPDAHYKLADTAPGQVPTLKDVVRTARHPQFD